MSADRPWMPIVVALAVLAAVGSGCLVGPVLGIPCASDDECPTDMFCDLLEGSCLPVPGENAAPNLEIVAIEGPDGDVGPFIEVQSGVDLVILLHTENRGQSPAREISIELSRLHCAHPFIQPSGIPDQIEGGEMVKIPMELFIDLDCSNPVPYDWFVRFSGRERRGVFEIFNTAELSQE